MSDIFSSSWTVIALVLLNLLLNWLLNRMSDEEKTGTKGKLVKGSIAVITGLLVVSIAYTVMYLF